MQRNFDDLDPSRTLRRLVSEVQQEVETLRGHGLGADTDQSARNASTARLGTAWSSLVAELALEQAPELRNCPSCQGEVMRGATRCRYCLAFSNAAAPKAAVQ